MWYILCLHILTTAVCKAFLSSLISLTRTVLNVKSCDHATHALHELHWSSITASINYKLFSFLVQTHCRPTVNMHSSMRPMVTPSCRRQVKRLAIELFVTALVHRVLEKLLTKLNCCTALEMVVSFCYCRFLLYYYHSYYTAYEHEQWLRNAQ